MKMGYTLAHFYGFSVVIVYRLWLTLVKFVICCQQNINVLMSCGIILFDRWRIFNCWWRQSISSLQYYCSCLSELWAAINPVSPAYSDKL